MREWDTLVATALLGTQRRELELAALPDPVRRLAESGAAGPEHALLAAAALLAGYRKAGRLPERDVTVLSPAEPDSRELVGDRARRRLALLLTGDRVYLLGEWLSLVLRRELRVPPEFLPLLAETARMRPDLRRPVAAAAGSRGPWLAGLRPEWAFLAERVDADPEVWRFGTVGQRHAWLVSVRELDPDRAREALLEVWSKEPAPVRVQFLGVLRVGLSSKDEEFLEQALDDRAQDVRKLAAELLTALPESALSMRMADRLRPLISLEPRILRVKLPVACDEGMRRDGITAKAPRGIGERAWWLGQLVSAAPLSVWGDPAPLMHLPIDVDPRLLSLGWAAAAVREGNADWAFALLDGAMPLALDQQAALVAVLPRDRWAAMIARLTADRLHAGLFLALPPPWPADVGNHVLDRLLAHRDERAVAHVADIAARAVPPECFRHRLLDQPPDYEAAPWRRRLLDTLVFRRSMYEELS
jgi:hypothetical protein